MAKTVKRPAESWSYVLVADEALPLDQQTRFVLSPLSHPERAATRDSLSLQQSDRGLVTTLSRTRQVAYKLALDHIVSVENFPVGAPEPWPASPARRAAYLEQLHDDDVLELGNEIFVHSSVEFAQPGQSPKDGDVIKNSLKPGPTSSSGDSSPERTTT